MIVSSFRPTSPNIPAASYNSEVFTLSPLPIILVAQKSLGSPERANTFIRPEFWG